MAQSPYRLFMFVCVNSRPPQHPKGSCMARGGVDLLKALKEEADKQEVYDIRIQSSGCLGPCEMGASIVVYGRDSEPDGIWYKQVSLDDVPDLVTSHLKNGIPVERLRYNWEQAPSSGGLSLAL